MTALHPPPQDPLGVSPGSNAGARHSLGRRRAEASAGSAVAGHAATVGSPGRVSGELHGVLSNGGALPLADVPQVGQEEFRTRLMAPGLRLVTLFGVPTSGASVRLVAVWGGGEAGRLHVLATLVKDRFPSLTPALPQAHLFERVLAEDFGLVPEGHPWLKPVRFPAGDAGVMRFFAMSGEAIHEVAVGPVHAGVIEPGHFRFQCHGERVHHLEISLGYQHRGVERAMTGGPTLRTLPYMETVAGDSTIAHATAYAQLAEGLTGTAVPPRAQVLRGLALELERLANHIGDLGALAQDVGFLPTSSFCGRLRGDILNLTALLCGSRFGRGFIRPGGVGFNVDPARAAELGTKLEAALGDTASAVELLWHSPSVMTRFEGVGSLTAAQAGELGLVGVAARAAGLERDVRQEFPSGIFKFAHIPMSTMTTGDIFARAYVRWLEIQRSAAFIRDHLGRLPAGPIRVPLKAWAPHRLAVSLVEGWRGEVCHAARTDAKGRFSVYKIVDPSFHNWTGLALAMRGQAISDFPLCNKSFNLSYCGHDL